MRKILISIFCMSFCFSALGDLMISEVSDPEVSSARFVELYNSGSSAVNLSGYRFFRQNNGGIYEYSDLPDYELASGSCFLIATDIDSVNTVYETSFTGNNGYIVSNAADGNGLDGYFLRDINNSYALVDIYGVENQSGVGDPWSYVDKKAIRNSAVTSANTSWTASEWTITSELSGLETGTPGTHTTSIKDWMLQ